MSLIRVLLVPALAVFAIPAAGCAHKSAAKPTLAETPARHLQDPHSKTTVAVSAGEHTAATSIGDDSPPVFAPLYFDFDSSSLSAQARTELQQVGAYLMKHPASHATITGNTDDRGTEEYNIALGDRRARAAKDYVAALGIDPMRLASVSYGPDRPAVPGQDEAARAQNRRDEFGFTATPTAGR